MAASTIEQYLASCCHLEHYHDLIREGWEAAKHAEAVSSASANNARDEIAALVSHYDNRNDNGSFMNYIGSRIEAMRQLSPVA